MFSENAERKIVACVRDYERTSQNSIPKGRPPTITAPNRVVKTTTTIKPASGATPGKGSAIMQVFDGTSFKSMGVNISVYNITSSTIKSGVYVQVVVIDGHFFYDVTSCENGS